MIAARYGDVIEELYTMTARATEQELMRAIVRTQLQSSLRTLIWRRLPWRWPLTANDLGCLKY